MLNNYCCAQMSNFKRLRLLGHTLRQGYDVRPVYTFCTKQLKAYKRMPTTRLLTDVKKKRSVRCRALYTRFSKSDVKNIVFTDEKDFTLKIPLNRQINSRVYGSSNEGKSSIAPERLYYHESDETSRFSKN